MRPAAGDPRPQTGATAAGTDQVRTLLVASAGGHFEELRLLRDRLGVKPDDSMWVTSDTPQTRSLLGSDDRLFVQHAYPRDVRRALEHARIARHVLKDGQWDRVVSTGSLIAVPFMAVARAYRIDCHYIESAARMTGPSLSARILERVPGVHCYGQSRTWAVSRRSWRYGGSVFDAFVPTTRPPRQIRRVVVTLGTNKFGFSRLVDALVSVLPRSAEVTWQLGSTSTVNPGVEGQTYLPQHELAAAMSEADLVIAHAGVGTALQAMAEGQCPILVPRREDRGEHIDNHQFEIAAELSNSGLAVFAEPEDFTLEMLEAATARCVRPNPQLPDFVLDET